MLIVSIFSLLIPYMLGADAASHAIAAAFTGSLATQAIIFFFIWAEKSLRRARRQRRSESAEDDVESGARSPQ